MHTRSCQYDSLLHPSQHPKLASSSSLSANTTFQILRMELQEIESCILEGQVTCDLSLRCKGRGSFGDVYMGKMDGLVSNSLHY